MNPCQTCKHLGITYCALETDPEDCTKKESCTYHRAISPVDVWIVLHYDEPVGAYLHENAAQMRLKRIIRDYTPGQWKLNPCARIEKTHLEFDR